MPYMRRTVTLSLSETTRRQLDRIAKEEGVSRSDVVRESLRDYFFKRELRRLRSQLLPAAQKRGIHTDEDVFERVS